LTSLHKVSYFTKKKVSGSCAGLCELYITPILCSLVSIVPFSSRSIVSRICWRRLSNGVATDDEKQETLFLYKDSSSVLGTTRYSFLCYRRLIHSGCSVSVEKLSTHLCLVHALYCQSPPMFLW
jgi:hypothetical protein